MPQVIVKGISREKTAALAPRIAETVASIIAVPEEWIVVEHNEVAFFRGGKADARSAMVVIQWKQRPKELQEKVAKALADLLLAEGSRPVEIIYQNLDMDDVEMPDHCGEKGSLCRPHRPVLRPRYRPL